jgi:hypothetical protein
LDSTPNDLKLIARLEILPVSSQDSGTALRQTPDFSDPKPHRWLSWNLGNPFHLCIRSQADRNSPLKFYIVGRIGLDEIETNLRRQRARSPSEDGGMPA